MMGWKILLPVVLMVTTGCTTTTNTSTAERVSDGDQSAAVSSTQNLRSGLPPQRLDPGDCGLFLWSQTEITRLVFFARAGENVASVFIEDGAVPLTLTRARGDIFGQFLTDLTYVIPASDRQISVTFTPGEELEGGARISSGRISYMDSEGWTRVLPVLGVRACQPLLDTPLAP
ncbi:MAG: hypothetical protein AAFY34_09435 [Pseudomonadota bacterium]